MKMKVLYIKAENMKDGDFDIMLKFVNNNKNLDYYLTGINMGGIMRTFICIAVNDDNYNEVKEKLFSKYNTPSHITDFQNYEDYKYPYLSIEISMENEHADHLTIHPLNDDDVDVKNFEIIYSNIDDIFDDIDMHITTKKLGLS